MYEWLLNVEFYVECTTYGPNLILSPYYHLSQPLITNQRHILMLVSWCFDTLQTQHGVDIGN